MAKNPWTEQELVALDEVSPETGGMAAYHAWGSLTNYSKTFNAFEVKRRRVIQSSPATVGALEFRHAQAVEKERIKEALTHTFVGFNMAFWDLETTFSTQPIVLFGASADQFGRVTEFRKGDDITNDKVLVGEIRDFLNKQDIWVTWNGKLFDVPVLNGRLLFHGFEPLAPVMHIDLMYKATGSSVRIGRRSLQSVSEYYGVQNKKTPLTVSVWDAAMSGKEGAYELIAEHGHADVLVTRDVFQVLKPQIGVVNR